MQYLFSDSSGASVLVSIGPDRAELSALDSSMRVTSNQVTLKKNTARLIQALCEAFDQKQKVTSEMLEETIGAAHSTVTACRDRINEAFLKLGFTGKCIDPFQLADGYTCRIVFSSPVEDAVSDILEQELLFEDLSGVSRSVSAVGKKKYQYLPQKDTHYSCLMIHGIGGLGKTTFLKNLLDAWPGYMGKVFYCSLSVLLEEARTSPIMKQQHCGKDLSAAGCFGKVYSSYLFRHCGILSCDVAETYTFLLDGLNELTDRNNSQIYDCIRQIFDEIAMLNAKNVFVIITTRSRKDAALLHAFSTVRLATLSGVSEDAVAEIGVQSEEAKKLFRLPLFYLMYQRLHKQHKAIPESRYGIWNMFHRNACEQEYTRKNNPADEALYIYYIFLPMFAHFMESNRTDFITRAQAIRLIDKVQNSAAMQEICQNIINRIEDSRTRTQLQFLKVSQILYHSFRNLEYFIIFQEDRITFQHQEIREYFAAFYVVWYLKTIRSAPLTPEFTPNYNLKSDVQRLILNALGFLPTIPRNNPDTKELYLEIQRKNGKTYLELFGTTEPIRASTDIEEISSQICQNLYLAHSAKLFEYHFMLNLLESRHQILAPFCESLFRSKSFLADHSTMFRTEERQMMLEVYSSMMQDYRVHHDFGKCREIYDFCMEHLAGGCSPSYIRMLRHQRGKALLYNSQDLLTGVTPQSEYYPECEKSPEEIFAEAIKVLESCMPYNLTANILAHLYASPVKWITDNHLLKRDVCKAFSIYLQAYRDMIDSGYLLIRLGTEMIYTVKQMLGLLVKGYVRLSDHVPEESGVFPLNAAEESSETMRFTAEVLEHLTGQRYPFMDWIRGVSELFQGNQEAAQQYFANEKDHFLTKIIALQMHWTDDEKTLRKEISKSLFALRETAGQTVICEHTDSAYNLMDAEILGFAE